jgi:hypothetical protein
LLFHNQSPPQVPLYASINVAYPTHLFLDARILPPSAYAASASSPNLLTYDQALAEEEH